MMTNKSVVILNELQRATLKALAEVAVNGIVPGTAVAAYKLNVIGALLRAGAIRPYHKSYKLNDVIVQHKPVSTPRAAKRQLAA